MRDKTFYEFLKKKKERGEELDFDKLDYDKLRLLWWDELCSDNMIAQLYDVTKYKIKGKRERLGIKHQELAMEQVYKGLEKETNPLTGEHWPAAAEFNKTVNEQKEKQNQAAATKTDDKDTHDEK